MTSRKVKTASGTIVAQQTQIFDELGRLLRSIGAAGQTTTFGYDRTDLPTAITDPRSNLYSFAYDALTRLIRETDQVGAQVNYTLNAHDALTGYSDPRSLVTSYVRNGFGDVIQEASPDAGTSIIIRDARGRATQITDARGVVANLTYDNAGRLLTQTYPATPGNSITYNYDSTASGNKGKGRLTSLADQTGSMARSYDKRGNILSDDRIIAGKTYATGYSWSLGDRLEAITYPSGRVVTFVRNALGQATDVTTNQNALSPAVDVATGIVYAAMSDSVVGLTYGNGLVYSAIYDQDYRLTDQSVFDGGTPLLDFTYSYGDGINLTSISDAVVPSDSMSFTYTAANRLSHAVGPWGTFDWTYDGVGNRLSESLAGTVDSYVYASTDNRLSSITRSGTPVRTFVHDAIGNIATDTRGTDFVTYTYDDRGRPVSVSRNGGAWASYGYNGLEQLVSRSTVAPSGPAGGIHYVYDLDGHLIAEADALTGATIREYIWLDDRPIATVDAVSTTPVLYFVHTDHLDRPLKVTDSLRTVVWSAVWKPFGEPQSITGPLTLDARFPGQWFQIETGLSYNWHRHYDASTGRYTQPDPLGFVDGPSLYAYAHSSPQNYVDRDGRNPSLAIQACLKIPACARALATGIAVTIKVTGEMCVWAYKQTIGYSGGGGDDEDDECDTRYARELANCRARRSDMVHPDYYFGCKARAEDRRTICKRNQRGNKQSEPPEWSNADEETWRNFGR